MQTEVERRRAGELERPLARPAGPTAVYDTVTEGMTGWRFLRTRRWIGFTLAAVLFAIACAFLANWQFDRGREATANNATVAANFAAEPVPLEQALPSLGSYDPSQNWQRVTVSGVYVADDELVVRNRSNGGENGFEVLTPLRLADGSLFVVDRGWVAPSAGDPLAPGPVAAPATGTVTVAAQLRPSEAAGGTGASTGNQVATIALPRVQEKIGGDVYTGAYGMLVGQFPAATGLAPLQTTMPTEDVGTHYSYMIQWLAFALIGFLALGLAARNVYRQLNADDPEERERAASRLQKSARRAFTDEELEDEELDGFIPLTRWGGAAAGARAGTAPRPVGGTATPAGTLGTAAGGTVAGGTVAGATAAALPAPPAADAAAHDIYVLDPTPPTPPAPPA
ncbi:SURF1 family protein [Subtercola sp. Z020]|uniref:SURF1 family cytochrome oxidase biogenesis protein n=1 Tax=Subtercola sp. Z020 TaxID=2080582 RepID=UPI001E4EEFF8|nr:SURF1 family protein [Subtercola sp. Z020]